MNKKGFTLIELLMVIAIIAIISMILIPNVININENKYDLGFTCDNTKKIPISKLIEAGKLDGDIDGAIKNPINNENLTSKSVTVKFNCQTKQFTYDFDYNCQ